MRFSQPFPIRKALPMVLEEILRQEKQGFFPSLIRSLLLPPSLFFYAGIKIRNVLFDTGLKRQTKCNACVVSVGNIMAGGTGKTPFILMLAKSLKNFKKLAILSRGYRSEAEKNNEPQIVKPEDVTSKIGDEPAFLLSQLPDVMIVVGKDRVKAATLAIQHGAEVLLLDDGMQHRRLYRDFEIVMVNGKELNGGPRYLPRGMLRDEPKRIRKAHLVVTSGETSAVRPWTEAPVIQVKNKVTGIVFADGQCKTDLSQQKVALFCGLSDPSRFLKTMGELGIKEIVLVSLLGDHKKMTAKQLLKFAVKAKKRGADLLLCTEKDSIKLERDEATKLPLPLAWVTTTNVITENEEAFSELIEKIRGRNL